jgi:hypothetical protein
MAHTVAHHLNPGTHGRPPLGHHDVRQHAADQRLTPRQRGTLKASYTPRRLRAMFGRMKDPVDGTATLVSYTETGGVGHSSLAVSARIVLHAAGMEPLAVDVKIRVPQSELPLTAGEVWNVQFDRDQLSHVKFSWAVTDELDHESLREVERELSVDEVRVLDASRRRGSK